MDYTLLARHIAYRGGLRASIVRIERLRLRAAILTILKFKCTPWVHIKSRWAVRTGKRSILKILKKHRGL